jgi:hypothetical protein
LLVTAVKNFLVDRGVVLDLLKGFVGFSSAIFTQLYRAIYGTDNDGADLVLLWSWRCSPPPSPVIRSNSSCAEADPSYPIGQQLPASLAQF